VQVRCEIPYAVVEIALASCLITHMVHIMRSRWQWHYYAHVDALFGLQNAGYVYITYNAWLMRCR